MCEPAGPVGAEVDRRALEDLAERARTGVAGALGGAHAYDETLAAGYRRSAVLLLFTPAAEPTPTSAAGDGVDLFLVQRSPLLRLHPGQIALPGGRIEESDASPVDAALRETHEEIGVAPHRVAVLGALAEVLVPLSRFVVTPVLGWTPDADGVDDVVPGEVLHTLRVRVADLLDPAARATVTIAGHGSAGFRLPTGWVWGFTGNLLDHVFSELGWARPWDTARRYVMTMAEARGADLVVPPVGD